jgi:hypothetical protein
LGEGPGRRREGPPEVCEFRSAHCGGRRHQPALRPIRDGSEHRLERSPSRCQSIAHSNRRTWIDESLDKTFGLELTQPLGENTVADAGYPGEQLIESSGGWKEGFDHGSGPTLSYQLDSTLKGRAVVKSPSDHGERFYALSDILERTRKVFSTRNFSVFHFSVWDSGLPWT